MLQQLIYPWRKRKGKKQEEWQLEEPYRQIRSLPMWLPWMRFYGAHSLRICKIGSSPGCLSLHLHGLALSAKGVFFFLPLCPSLLLFPSSFPPPHSCLSSTAFLGVDFCRSWWSVFEIVLEITRILSLCLPCANVYISNNKLKSNF